MLCVENLAFCLHAPPSILLTHAPPLPHFLSQNQINKRGRTALDVASGEAMEVRRDLCECISRRPGSHSPRAISRSCSSATAASWVRTRQVPPALPAGAVVRQTRAWIDSLCRVESCLNNPTTLLQARATVQCTQAGAGQAAICGRRFCTAHTLAVAVLWPQARLLGWQSGGKPLFPSCFARPRSNICRR